MQAKVLAIVMAGGEGSRLAPLTEVRAKPAVPYGGVYRLIDIPLSNCVHSGISDVWIVQQYQPHVLTEHLRNGRPWDLDRTYGGLLVLQPHTGTDDGGWHEGNADALYRHRRLIREQDPDVVIVLSADHVYRLDFRQVVDAHRRHGAELTMVTSEADPDDAGRYGVVEVGDDDLVTGFEYKPDEPRTTTVTTEVFVFDADRLLEVLDQLGAENGDGDEPAVHDLGHEVIPAFVGRERTYAFPLDGYWRDVGTVDAYWSSHMDLLDRPEELDLDADPWPLLSAGRPRMAARFEPGSSVSASLVSGGCRVAGTVEHSVLAPGVVVEAGATVRDSVVLHEAVVRSGATVEKAILDMRAEVASGAEVRGGDEIAVVREGAHVGAG